MSYKQIMQHRNCRTMMKQDLDATAQRRQQARHHGSAHRRGSAHHKTRRHHR